MKRLTFLSTLLLLCLVPLISVQAQGSTRLDSLQVSLWPEYDDPRLLVLIDGVLATPGQTVQVPAPAGALINAVASFNEEGRLVDTPYQTSSDLEGNQVLTFTPASTSFRVEYYTPLLSNGDERTFTFSLPSSYLITADGLIEILLPPDANSVEGDPPLNPAESSLLGAADLARSFSNLEGEGPVEQTLRYNNPTGALSVPETARQAQAPQPAPAPATTSTADDNSGNLLTIGLIAGAVLLIALGGYGLWRTRQPAQPALVTTSQRRDRPRQKPVPPAGPAASSGPVSAPMGVAGRDRYCRQCGAEFGSEDRFCRHCGTART